MRFYDFEHIMSTERLQKYVDACNGDTRKAMTLYRLNLKASQEMFTVVSCFEVALRNAIDYILSQRFGQHWLRDSVQNGGILSANNVRLTRNIITNAYNDLLRHNSYIPSKLLSSMEFGVWKYMYSPAQYRATGQCLLQVFPNKPRSNRTTQYNNTYLFNELDKVNSLRNRIAHHEPIIFVPGNIHADTSYILNEYQKIQALFMWMGIDSHSLLFGLDHVINVCQEIQNITINQNKNKS